ncbi:AAA family ATPase [Bradymonas sediminis]|uniref:Uncharacterized protein n=1 Tax=Bradymonas sediminis TaxID=1548548 RepID=A0A2Z4FLA3_9DELT|nr:AAA family ATPase [Bradymonas sediminis]AWV89733.1 hypothetical protein DN745_10430 [Bradymonas sediminis]TDP76522.1 ATP-dependent Clp protease ATP-binding subunit ClpA [Bradymonas sediminis]
MKLTLSIYVAQPQKGHFRASIPWVNLLAHPVEGSSPARLKEELMFRALEMVHGGIAPGDLHSLLGPKNPQMLNFWVDLHRRIDPDRPPVRMGTWTHVIAGRLPGDDLIHVWIPLLPGACFAVERMDDVYEGLCAWAEQWAEANHISDFSVLTAEYPARMETIEVDLGFPSVDSRDDDEDRPAGRMRRPEALSKVATNLTHHADDKSLRRAYGRQEIIDELVEVMTAERASHICLVGPKGAGKSALIEEAARQTLEMQRAYQQRRDIWQTSGDRIIAGMSIIGQWEQRAEALCSELEARNDVLAVDDLLGLVRAGRTYQGDSSVARFIEPYLEQGRFSVIAEATEATFEAARGEAAGFVDRFRRIQVPALEADPTITILNELVRALEAQQRVRFTPDAVESIVRLSARYFRQEAFPGKAIRLARQCFSAGVRKLSDASEYEVRIDPQWVAEVVHRQTGLPMRLLVPGQGREPAEVERAFVSRVFDQPQATEVLSALIVATEQGLCDPKRPLGSFLLIGPSGVGKTETAKALAEDLFGGRDRLVRFDMSEFSEASASTRLIGTTHEPDGELTGRVRIQPFCVLLFDEIEKSHPMALDLLLQLLGDGRLSDAAGRTVDFSNTVVLMTSNLGAGSEDRWLGFSPTSEKDRQLHYRRAAQQFFRPELFNRIDRVIPYQPLSARTLKRIAQRTLRELLERRGLRQGRVMVDVDRRLVEHLVGDTVDRRYGARTLSHRIEQRLITPLARMLAGHDPNKKGLTRALLGVDGVGELDLKLLQLNEAARVELRPVGVELFVDHSDGDSLEGAADRLQTRLEYLIQGLEALEASPQRAQVDRDYVEALNELNARAANGAQLGDEPLAHEIAERVRQREIFRQRLRELRQRIEGLVDPEQTGAWEMPDLESFDKPRLHRWNELVDQIFGELSWSRTQALSLAAAPADQATLIVEGLSGNTADILAHWQRWMRALAQGLNINMAEAAWTSDGWKEAGADLAQVSALAFSAEHPGIRAAFEALAGYMWAPMPASHGHHGLALLSAESAGSSENSLLLRHLEAREDSATPGERFDVEFVLENSQLSQPRLATRRALPPARANASDFAKRLVFERLALNFENASLESE